MLENKDSIGARLFEQPKPTPPPKPDPLPPAPSPPEEPPPDIVPVPTLPDSRPTNAIQNEYKKPRLAQFSF